MSRRYAKKTKNKNNNEKNKNRGHQSWAVRIVLVDFGLAVPSGDISDVEAKCLDAYRSVDLWCHQFKKRSRADLCRRLDFLLESA